MLECSAQSERLAYRPAEAAALLGVSRSYLYELLATGELTGRKVGRATVLLHADLVEYVNRLPIYTPEARDVVAGV